MLHATSLKGRITYARWSLFGHVLRLVRDTPAHKTMDYYTQVEDKGSGRPVTTLPVVLFNEYKKYMIEKRREEKKNIKTYQRSNYKMLAELRESAGDRKWWRDIVAKIASSTQSE